MPASCGIYFYRKEKLTEMSRKNAFIVNPYRQFPAKQIFLLPSKIVNPYRQSFQLSMD
jgi:hypothetical protein